MSYTCHSCGGTHDELPMAFGIEAPWRSFVDDPSEFEERVILTPDQCIVDREHFFVRGQLSIPVPELGEDFVWTVWSSLSKDSFRTMGERWNVQGREHDEPYFGWLCSDLPGYGVPTIQVPLAVHTAPLGRVPEFVVHECDHPLRREQQEGLSLEVLHRRIDELLERPGRQAWRRRYGGDVGRR